MAEGLVIAAGLGGNFPGALVAAGFGLCVLFATPDSGGRFDAVAMGRGAAARYVGTG